MTRTRLIAAIATAFALASLQGTPALAQSKGSSRDARGASKSEQSREPVRGKAREPGPSKSEGRDSGRSGSKSKR